MSSKRKRDASVGGVKKKVLVLVREKSFHGDHRGTSCNIRTLFVSPSDLPERYRKESDGAIAQANIKLDFTKVDHNTAIGRYAEHQEIKKLDKDDRALWRRIADASDDCGKFYIDDDNSLFNDDDGRLDQVIGTLVVDLDVVD